MDFFERAHIPKKHKMENKPNEALKRQLKQVMNAYKNGNNQDIRNSAESKPKFDFDETISISDDPDVSGIKDAENSLATFNGSDEPQSLSNDTSKSDSLDTDEHTQENSSEDMISECCEEFKALTTSLDDSAASFNSAELDYSDSNEFSIPSSLQTSSASDVEFDVDGILASKILERLDKKDKASKNTNKPKENIEEVKKDVKKTKPRKETYKHSTHYFLEEDVGSDFENNLLETKQNWQDLKKVTLKESKKMKKSKKSQQIIELSDKSINSSMDSMSTNVSSPFISVSAENMSNQSLSDLLGNYVHSTIRLLPTDQSSPALNASSMFSADDMIVNDVIDDELSSLIPEVDEDLAVEDLSDTYTDTQEINSFKDTTPTDDTTDLYNEDITIDSVAIDETIEDDFDSRDVPIALYNGKEKYVLVMKHPSELYIHGKLQIADINGMVEIFGYKMNYDCLEVYAPYCNFAYCLRTLETPHETNPDLFNELMSAGLSESDAQKIVLNIEDNTAVVLLSKLNNLMINFVDNKFSTAELFSKRTDHSPSLLKKVADSLGCSFYLKPPKRRFEDKPVWDDVYISASAGSRGIICGGKGTGKSTFLRHYVNTLLADGPVLVVDLDPGQAEFTVPGNISATIVKRPLIGPNFTHLKCPNKMLNIGMINTMDNATRYLSAVSELIAYCHNTEAFRHLPWIVNTMGLCNHMGLKFMTSIILQLQPTFLFQIDSKIPKKRFDVQLDFHNIAQLYEKFYRNDISFRDIPDPSNMLMYSFVLAPYEDLAKGTVGSSLLPRDERYLNILAYFGELLNDHMSQELLEIMPYQVNFKNLNIGLNVKIPTNSVAKIINGKIIALCQLKTRVMGEVFTLEDKALICHGHGLVRGIDFEQEILYVLTPTPFGNMALVDTLVYSDWMPELRGLEHDLPSGTAIPYRTASTALHQRKLMFPPRRRFNPLQLLRMSRNS